MRAPANINVSNVVPMARRAAEAQREYNENRTSDEMLRPIIDSAVKRVEEGEKGAAIDAALRTSLDLAPAFAEPGEMERREKAETDEAGFRTIAVAIAIAIGCLAASPILAILIATYMRGGL